MGPGHLPDTFPCDANVEIVFPLASCSDVKEIQSIIHVLFHLVCRGTITYLGIKSIKTLLYHFGNFRKNKRAWTEL